MVIEYRDIEGSGIARSERTQIEQREAKRNIYRLVHKTAGWECAGSCARLTNESWGVLFYAHNATHGQWFKSLAEARELFDKWTLATVAA